MLWARSGDFAEVGAGRRSRTARLRDAPSKQAGFGLLEVVIASGVMLTALTSMAYVITNTLYDISGANHRQTAIALADEAVEQARALPYPTIARGVETAYLAGDPRVVGTGAAAALATTGERIVHYANNPTVAPLVPNVSSRTIGGVVYAVRFYVSHFDNNPALGMFTLTAFVDWRGGRGNQASSVRATSVVYSPSAALLQSPGVGQGGCITAVSPFTGACPVYVEAKSDVLPGQIRLSGSGSSGATLTSTSSELPSAASRLESGQVVKTEGVGKGGGVVLSGAPVGQPTSFTVADNIPGGNPDPVGPSQSQVATSSSTSVSQSAGPGTVSLTITGTPSLDRSESSSTVAAGGSQCPDPVGVLLTDGLPCDRSVGEQGGALRQAFDLAPLGLGSLVLSEVAAPPSPVVAYTKHIESNVDPSKPCLGTGASGCVQSYASRSIGRVRVGGLPSVAGLPALFSGYLYELDNYADSVSVEAGIDASAVADIPPPTGTLKYWAGPLSGYTTVNMSATGGGLSVTTPVVSVSLGLYEVSASSTIRQGATTQQALTATCAGGLACVTSSEAVLGSPIVSTTTYTIKLAAATIYQLSVTVDLGELRVRAKHVDPP